MTTKEAILELISDFDLTIQQSLNFIAYTLFVIGGIMLFTNVLVPCFKGLCEVVNVLIEKIKAKKEGKKNESNDN